MTDMTDKKIANNLGRVFKDAVEQMRFEDALICFSGTKYRVRVMNQNTDREQLVIEKFGDAFWKKPLVIGG